MKQATLFAELNADQFVGRTTVDVTFKGKLNLPIHRWYRLTPSFSPTLANDIADHFEITSTDFVLDPFSGVGTVPLCMKYRGIPACSVELNPYLHFVSSVKTRTYSNRPGLNRVFTRFIEDARGATEGLGTVRAARSFLLKNAEYVPPIHKPERWWSPCNMAQLVAVRRLLLDAEGSGHSHDLLRMGVLGVLIPTSNAKHNHVSLTFAKEPLPTVDVVGLLQRKLDEIANDLAAVSNVPCAEVRVYKGNSKQLCTVLPKSPEVSHVITSPPYPNRFSYARETRPHLFFFGFIDSAKSVGELETAAIGGTWGKATSVLANGVKPEHPVVAELLAPHLNGSPDHGGLMASYVTKYFNDMFVHAGEIASVCRKRAKLAYVIGNSKFYGNPLPSDEILAAIFEYHGFSLEGIFKMRRRQSKTGLYEAVVMMQR